MTTQLGPMTLNDMNITLAGLDREIHHLNVFLSIPITLNTPSNDIALQGWSEYYGQEGGTVKKDFL